MAATNPVVMALPENVWTKVATAITAVSIAKISNSPNVYKQTVVISGSSSPADDTQSTLMFDGSEISKVNVSQSSDVYIKPVGVAGSVLIETLKNGGGKTDPITGFSAVADAGHVERHEGEMWVCSHEFLGGLAGTFTKFLFTAGATKDSHITWKMSGDDKFFFRAYADPTVTAAGTPASVVRNANLGILTSPLSVMTVAPTITVNGDQIDFDYADKVVISRSHEFIVPANGQVLFDLEMIKDAMVGGGTIEWYEE